jgi:hypothetical protein
VSKIWEKINKETEEKLNYLTGVINKRKRKGNLGLRWWWKLRSLFFQSVYVDIC